MAKSLRSKWKRKMRAEKREKFKVKEKERLLTMLGISESGKDVTMAESSSTVESSGAEKVELAHVDTETQNEVVQNNEGDVDMTEGKTKKPKIKNNKKTFKKLKNKKTIKRLGNKKRKGKKAFKW